MLDASFTVEASSAKSYPPIPADVYQAQILDIEKRQEKAYQSEELEDRLNFTFVIVEDGPYYGRRFWRSMAPKLVGGTKQSNLYAFLAVLTGKAFTKEECAKAKDIVTADYLNGLVGKQVRLSVSSKVGEDGVERNRVSAFLPVKEELPPFDESKVVPF